MTSSGEEYERILEQTHEAAVLAIREGRAGFYRSLAEVYVQFLIGIPEEWARYGQMFAQPLADGLDPLSSTPISRIERLLFLEIREALRRDTRETADEALGIPFHVASSVVSKHATGVIEPMLALLSTGYGLSVREADPRYSEELAEKSWRLILDFAQYVAAPQLEDEATRAQSGPVGSVIEASYFAINQLMRNALDLERPDDIRTIDDRWSQVLEYWDVVEPAYPPDDQIQLAVASTQDRAFELKRSLERLRLGLRFGLVTWMLRSESSSLNPTSDLAFHSLSRHFSTLESAAEGLDAALELWWQHGKTPWTFGSWKNYRKVECMRLA